LIFEKVRGGKGGQTAVTSALAKAVSWFLFFVHGCLKRWGETKIEQQKIEKDGLLATGDSARQSEGRQEQGFDICTLRPLREMGEARQVGELRVRDGIEWMSASLSALTGMRELGSCPLPSGLPD